MTTEASRPDAPSIEEFADEYTVAERIRFVVVGAIAGGSIVAVSKLWVFPGLRVFSVSADCQSVFGMKDTTVLGYGLFERVRGESSVPTVASPPPLKFTVERPFFGLTSLFGQQLPLATGRFPVGYLLWELE